MVYVSLVTVLWYDRIDEDNIIIAIVNIVFINTSIYEDHLCLQPCAGWEGTEGMKHSVNSHYSEY